MIATQHLGLAGATGVTSAFNLTRGAMLANRVKTAETMLDRRTGLLNRDSLDIGEGLHIVPCDSVHTVGMKFDIDIVFLDATGKVLKTWKQVQPGCAGLGYYRASSALELPAGMIAATDTRTGDRLQFTEAEC